MSPGPLRAAACILLALATCAAAPATAADAPDWLLAAARQADPPHEDEAGAVVLYADEVFTVRKDGRAVDAERRALRVLRPGAAGHALLRRSFDEQARITTMRGWCITPAGKTLVAKERDTVDAALSDVENGYLMSDERQKLMRLPCDEPGSVIGYEVQQEQRPYFLVDEWDLEDDVPVLESRYTLQLPPGWSYHGTWVNHEPVAAESTAPAQWTWTVRDQAAVAIEPSMPPWHAIAARMVVTPVPPGAAAAEGEGTLSWAQLGRWYDGLASDRRQATPELAQKVQALTAGQESTLQRVRTLARFVQGEIRYVAIELGIGGHQPHAAGETLAHGYGDCKDKATLLATMLAGVGVEAYPVIINTVRGAVTGATPPSLDFNHVIVAIRLPDDVADPSLRAVSQHPRLGRLLYFDPTDEFTPLGDLGGYLQGNFGLLARRDDSELVQLPLLPPATSGIQRTATLVLDAEGTLRGTVQELYRGDAAEAQRVRQRGLAREVDRVKPVEEFLAASLGRFQLEGATGGGNAGLDSPVRWDYSLTAPAYARRTGDMLLLKPHVLGTLARGFLENQPHARRQAVELDGPELDSDTFEIELPAGYRPESLPAALDVQLPFASYHSSYSVKAGKLSRQRSLEIRQPDISAAAAADLLQLYRTITGDERRTVVLVH